MKGKECLKHHVNLYMQNLPQTSIRIFTNTPSKLKLELRSNALQLWNCHTLGYKNVSAGGGKEGIRLLLSSFPFRMHFSFLLVQCWLSPFSLCSVGFLLSLCAVLAFSFLFVKCWLSFPP